MMLKNAAILFISLSLCFASTSQANPDQAKFEKILKVDLPKKVLELAHKHKLTSTNRKDLSKFILSVFLILDAANKLAESAALDAVANGAERPNGVCGGGDIARRAVSHAWREDTLHRVSHAGNELLQRVPGKIVYDENGDVDHILLHYENSYSEVARIARDAMEGPEKRRTNKKNVWYLARTSTYVAAKKALGPSTTPTEAGQFVYGKALLAVLTWLFESADARNVIEEVFLATQPDSYEQLGIVDIQGAGDWYRFYADLHSLFPEGTLELTWLNALVSSLPWPEFLVVEGYLFDQESSIRNFPPEILEIILRFTTSSTASLIFPEHGAHLYSRRR